MQFKEELKMRKSNDFKANSYDDGNKDKTGCWPKIILKAAQRYENICNSL
jgi:hypothetical protein